MRSKIIAVFLACMVLVSCSSEPEFYDELNTEISDVVEEIEGTEVEPVESGAVDPFGYVIASLKGCSTLYIQQNSYQGYFNENGEKVRVSSGDMIILGVDLENGYCDYTIGDVRYAYDSVHDRYFMLDDMFDWNLQYGELLKPVVNMSARDAWFLYCDYIGYKSLPDFYKMGDVYIGEDVSSEVAVKNYDSVGRRIVEIALEGYYPKLTDTITYYVGSSEYYYETVLSVVSADSDGIYLPFLDEDEVESSGEE